MNLSGDVLFDYDKAALKPAAEEALKKVAVVLSQFPEEHGNDRRLHRFQGR